MENTTIQLVHFFRSHFYSTDSKLSCNYCLFLKRELHPKPKFSISVLKMINVFGRGGNIYHYIEANCLEELKMALQMLPSQYYFVAQESFCSLFQLGVQFNNTISLSVIYLSNISTTAIYRR